MTNAETPRPTKERLIHAAAGLFRTHGYHGVGLSDLLSAAKAPKGSLYHHFPNGKSDLALAAATWASDGMLRIIAQSFADAPGFHEGAKTLCYKLAKLFDLANQWTGCPISATLFIGPENEDFRIHTQLLYDGWIAEVRDHAERFGMTESEAQQISEHMFILIQGAWMLARARRDTDVIRNLHQML